MLACARVDLGLAAAEFYDLTPRQFDTLVRHYRSRQRAQREHSEFLFGQLTAAVYNSGFVRFEEWQVAKNFMPSQQAQAADDDVEETEEEYEARQQRIADKLRATMAELMKRQNG